eukprot:GHRQ01022726.1.p1 GENE.GHRQ01022726.1~~GHRQ01022726.1.p1  ORF type:complete len:163 (+),score=50.87 GHRQ01022726.1:112-600(+)
MQSSWDADVSFSCALQVAWQMLGIPQLNAELRSPVTQAELHARALSDRGRLTSDNAAALLPPFDVDMGIAAAGQGPRVFWVEVSNEGQLPLKWELHSYDAPEVGAAAAVDAQQARLVQPRLQRTACCSCCWHGLARRCFSANPELPCLLLAADKGSPTLPAS